MTDVPRHGVLYFIQERVESYRLFADLSRVAEKFHV